MANLLEENQPDRDVRETLLEVRAKLKTALHLARDRADRRFPTIIVKRGKGT